MELQYTLDSPIIGESRNYRNSAKRLLLQETNFKCAKCSTMANYNSDVDMNFLSSSENRTNLEIAHIYGLRNFGNVEHGSNKFHIDDVGSINSYENLILLCSECHREYDKNPTYEKYVEMFDLKCNISQTSNIRNLVYNILYFCLDDIVDLCTSINCDDTIFNYDAEVFLKKLDINRIDFINKNHYSAYLSDYGQYIDDFFHDASRNIGIKLTKVFSNIYSELKDQYEDKNKILAEISNNEAISVLSEKINYRLFDALVSYMIWKCEVLDKNDTTE